MVFSCSFSAQPHWAAGPDDVPSIDLPRSFGQRPREAYHPQVFDDGSVVDQNYVSLLVYKPY